MERSEQTPEEWVTQVGVLAFTPQYFQCPRRLHANRTQWTPWDLCYSPWEIPGDYKAVLDQCQQQDHARFSGLLASSLFQTIQHENTIEM